MVRPDFFIVGAPRCGTTALYAYLRKHPQISMPEHKEPMYFGRDLTSLHERLTERDYLDLFRSATPGQRVGEASTWYLYSRTAAREIVEFSPNAQIIIMLRNPVDVMYSLHGELSFYGGEVVHDFAEALRLEPERMAGRNRGPSRRPEALYYRDTVRFAEQIERYHEVFGRDRVRVIVYDQFAADVPAAYAETLRFLGVDDAFQPEFGIVNESKRPRLRRLQAVIVRPPRPVARLIPMLRRFPWAHRLRERILLANSRSVRRQPLDPELRRRLTLELQPEVERLERLIGADLSAWKQGEELRQATPVTA
jgi:hypothetical protein